MKTFELRDRFFSLVNQFEISEQTIDQVFDTIVRRYSEPHRRYHNLTHIESMLESMNSHRLESVELELAIWFHDIIYDPRSATNESDSADLFAEALGSFLEERLVEEIYALIVATKHGKATPKSKSALSLCDLDLEILAASPEAYQCYRDAIREEFIHVPDESYAKGRTKFLIKMLDQPIFRTTAFQSSEVRARENINAEIQYLSRSEKR